MPYKDPQAAREYFKKYYQKNKARVDARNKSNYKNYHARYAEKKRMWALKRKYGVDGSLASSACDACGGSFGEYHGVCADHDHLTDRFHGWLCNDCNLALGYAKDSRQRLQLLISYLTRHETLCACG